MLVAIIRLLEITHFSYIKKGWSGINIDLDSHIIEMFNYFRPKDYNVNSAVSNSKEETDLFFIMNAQQ